RSGITPRNACCVGEVPGTVANCDGQSPEMSGFAGPATGRHHAGHVTELSEEIEQLRRIMGGLMSLVHREPRCDRGARALLLAALLGASINAFAIDAAPAGIDVVIIDETQRGWDKGV